MRIDVVTLFPPMFAAVTDYGITGRAVQQGLLEVGLWNPRDFTHDRYQQVDDRPYGGGPGMVMQYQPLHDAVTSARGAAEAPAHVVYLSPQGRPLDQGRVVELAGRPRLILVAGRYEGVDERFIAAEVDEELSLGDYVLSGGELAAMVVIDATTRLLPGALGHADSAAQDSFTDGLLDCPHYTRPEHIAGQTVPPVLRSGDHQAIARWRRQQALGRTWERRPELLQHRKLDPDEEALLEAYRREREEH